VARLHVPLYFLLSKKHRGKVFVGPFELFIEEKRRSNNWGSGTDPTSLHEKLKIVN